MISTSALILLHRHQPRPAVMLNERSGMKHPVRRTLVASFDEVKSLVINRIA
jgi:hypothetical protein